MTDHNWSQLLFYVIFDDHNSIALFPAPRAMGASCSEVLGPPHRPHGTPRPPPRPPKELPEGSDSARAMDLQRLRDELKAKELLGWLKSVLVFVCFCCFSFFFGLDTTYFFFVLLSVFFLFFTFCFGNMFSGWKKLDHGISHGSPTKESLAALAKRCHWPQAGGS